MPDCPTPNKMLFVSRREALLYNKQIKKRGARQLKVYQCPSGLHWHLSSMPRRLGKQTRKKVAA